MYGRQYTSRARRHVESVGARRPAFQPVESFVPTASSADDALRRAVAFTSSSSADGPGTHPGSRGHSASFPDSHAFSNSDTAADSVSCASARAWPESSWHEDLGIA